MDLVLMFADDQYALIDFGGGEKLERFGVRTVRRETPSVDVGSANKSDWTFDAAFEKHYRSGAGQWEPDASPDDWSIDCLLYTSPSPRDS